ncbi:hypothetical protein L249_1569 [Ophiocordyceps polyrhachis-furcata BCC 54312]|uniref:Metaxin glutathione S-transferase domain-containing protein n=1 Tax=Ophiocordyceps polyrhachis-furcata BCC 54312 TaxID=1330021 RepID=A0A367L4L3_9HYPO|nr:hypothetical protein L249_1569 [Ophiocordyceps polyrhachis-furcata BCC 54312]
MTDRRRGWFAVPAPVSALFRLVPLRIYEAEALPIRAPSSSRPVPRLHVFAAFDEDDGLSFDPACLMWQTFLRIARIRVQLVSSSPHASPDGSLPFLLPDDKDPNPNIPLTGSAIARYIRAHVSDSTPHPHPPPPPKLEPYLALLTHTIRSAWLYALFLPANEPLLTKLYLSHPSATPPPFRLRSLRTTLDTLSSHRQHHPSPDALLADTRRAFTALDTLLGDDESWFFGLSNPGLFDAHVFSYTYLILNPPVPWAAGDFPLRDCLVGCRRLLAHCDALYAFCYHAVQ